MRVKQVSGISCNCLTFFVGRGEAKAPGVGENHGG